MARNNGAVTCGHDPCLLAVADQPCRAPADFYYYQVGKSHSALQAIHIGDSLPADVQGANNAELAAAILVNRWHKPLPRSGPYPTHMVEHVTELPRILKALQAT